MSTSNLLYISMLLMCITKLAGSYEVHNIGNDVKASVGGPDLTGGSAVFLLRDPFPQSGVLFAFSAYFRNRNPLKFQVWRPKSTANSDFTLLAELEITPSVAGSAELVYIVSQLTEKCVRVRQGDRLGLYFVNSTSPLVYRFSSFSEKPQTLVHYSDGQPRPLSPNDTLKFDFRIFPYDFSLTAYYYLEDSNKDDEDLTLDCPKNQQIEGDSKSSSPTTPLPTGMPGATGMTGPKGSIGVNGPIGIVGSPGKIGATGEYGRRGQIGHAGSTGASGVLGDKGNAGDRGSVGLIGPKGSTGSTGPMGLTGEIGPPGFVTYTNETNANESELAESPDLLAGWSNIQHAWKDEAYMRGALIWLSIDSFIVLVLTVIVSAYTYACKLIHEKVEDVSGRMNLYGMTNTMTTTLQRVSNHGTMSDDKELDIDDDLRDMKEETFANYEVDTMEKYATKRLRPEKV